MGLSRGLVGGAGLGSGVSWEWIGIIWLRAGAHGARRPHPAACQRLACSAPVVSSASRLDQHSVENFRDAGFSILWETLRRVLIKRQDVAKQRREAKRAWPWHGWGPANK